MLRADYLAICDGHIAAAALLSLFEYWHNVRLAQSEKSAEQNAIAQKHGEEGTQDTSLFQFHTAEQLHSNLLGIAGKHAISDGLKLLEEAGFISIHKNPNPRYAFDSTKHFLLHVHSVQVALDAYFGRQDAETQAFQNGKSDIPKMGNPPIQNGQSVLPKRQDGLPKTGTTSHLITGEIANECEVKTLVSHKAADDPLFAAFWDAYPRKTAKEAAKKAWWRYGQRHPNGHAAVLPIILADIKARIEAGQWQLDRKEFIPHPATYINGERWHDEVIPPSGGGKPHEASRHAGRSRIDATSIDLHDTGWLDDDALEYIRQGAEIGERQRARLRSGKP